jgi:hypothetical protein
MIIYIIQMFYKLSYNLVDYFYSNISKLVSFGKFLPWGSGKLNGYKS